MKTIVYLLILFTYLSCKSKVEKNSYKEQNKTYDTLRLINILSANNYKSTSLLIINDTVFFITPYPYNLKKAKQGIISSFYYDSKKSGFQYNSNLNEEYQNNTLFQVNKCSVYLETLIKPDIHYVRRLKGNDIVKKAITKQTKIQLFRGKYYFIDRSFPKALYVYDSLTNIIKSYDLHDLFSEVTDFFLCDIDNDNEPEVFIFYLGDVPRDYAISYSIYSIRKDSTNVNYK
jgi:hypothetical protein